MHWVGQCRHRVFQGQRLLRLDRHPMPFVEVLPEGLGHMVDEACRYMRRQSPNICALGAYFDKSMISSSMPFSL